jgi:pyruvate,water dikinase
MAQKSCISFTEICRDDVPLVGGKGANLGEMTRAGLPVPPGYVICSHAYRNVIENSGLDTKINDLVSGVDLSVAADLQELERQIRDLFEDLVVPGDLSEEILASYDALGGDELVAVRSSATAEDLATASFAGQQETILNVTGADSLLEAIRRCWSSLYTSQAIFYRRRQGFDSHRVSMAVVVQKMVASEKSGVTFTIDPVLHNRYNMVIEAVWGLGEGIVSGAITPDHYKVDRDTYELMHQFIATKKIMFCRDGALGVVKLDVPADKASARVLTDDEMRQIVDLGNRLERHFGCPQDIEWGIENDSIYLLQSRPITAH